MKWMAKVFKGQVLFQKCRKQHRDAQIDDMELIKEETAARVQFQRGRVVEALPRVDRHVRSVEVEYKLFPAHCSVHTESSSDCASRLLI